MNKAILAQGDTRSEFQLFLPIRANSIYHTPYQPVGRLKIILPWAYKNVNATCLSWKSCDLIVILEVTSSHYVTFQRNQELNGAFYKIRM